MIVVKLACFAHLSTEFVTGRILHLVPVPRHGACAHIDDADPDVERLRARVRALHPRWAVHDDASDEGREILLTLTPSARPVAASITQATTQAPATWAEEERDKGAQIPEWVLVAARNGWEYIDVSSADWPHERSPLTGLSALDMTLCSPPPGWAEARQSNADVRPWHLPGFSPPEGWVAPATPAVVVPEPPADTSTDERFVDEPPQDGIVDEATPDAQDEQPAPAGPDRDVIARELAVALHISHDDAIDVIGRACRVPRPETGGPAPRGKVNAALRSKGVTLDVDAYNIIVPILNLQT
jgi:hypothetical protein